MTLSDAHTPVRDSGCVGLAFFFFLIKQTNLVYSGSKYLTNFYLLKNTYLTKKSTETTLSFSFYPSREVKHNLADRGFRPPRRCQAGTRRPRALRFSSKVEWNPWESFGSLSTSGGRFPSCFTVSPGARPTAKSSAPSKKGRTGGLGTLGGSAGRAHEPEGRACRASVGWRGAHVPRVLREHAPRGPTPRSQDCDTQQRCRRWFWGPLAEPASPAHTARRPRLKV